MYGLGIWLKIITISSDDDVEKACIPKNRELNEVWIRADLLDWPELECAVAHEVRHAWQKSSHPEVFADDCRAEADATPLRI